MKKDLQYYRALPYTRAIRPSEDGGWEASIEELPGCFAVGNTSGEAAILLDCAFDEYVEAKLAWGSDIVEPERRVRMHHRLLPRMRREEKWIPLRPTAAASGPPTNLIGSDAGAKNDGGRTYAIA